MKPKNNILLSLGCIAFAFASNAAHATTYTWNTNTSGALWSAPGSWVGATVPTFVAGDTFDLSTLNIGAATTSSMDTVGGNTLGTVKIGDTNSTHSWTLALTTALTLDGNGSAAAINQVSTSKGDTINGAGGIVLASDLNITNASNVSANILQISTGITATGATRTITNSGSGFTRVNLNGAIGAGINLVQNSTTSETWMLGSSASFNGTITVKAGGFEVGATGANGIGLGTAAFTLGDTTGSSDAFIIFKSGNGSGYSAPITVASGSSGIKSIIGAVTNGNNTYALNGAITLGPDSSNTADLTIGNSTGSTSTYNVNGGITGFGNVTVKTTSSGRTRFATTSINNTGTLTNSGTGTGVAQIDAVVGANVTGVVQNSSASQMNLTGANTYTGATTVTAGTLSVGSLANGGSNSNIGAATNVAGNLVLNGGTLQYTGAAVSTDRLFSLQSSSTINASGSGAVNFTNTGSMGFNGGTAAKTLTLTGTNTGANTLAALIGDNTGATSVIKSGAGTWTLTGANTYTGDTTVTAGVLAVKGTSIADANKLILNGGKVDATGTEVVGTLYFGATQQASGTWGSTTSGAAHQDDTHFSGTGVVSVTTGPAGYTAWADANGASGQTKDQDHDGDGVKNGIEYFMGETGSTFTANPAVVSGTVTWQMAATYTGVYGTDYEVQSSTDLVNWTQVPVGTGDNTVTVNPGPSPARSVVYDMPSGGKRFVRLVVQN